MGRYVIATRIMNEFPHGPAWAYEHGTSIEINGFPPVLNDWMVSRINAKMGDMLDSYCSFNGNEPCTFDHENRRENKKDADSLCESKRQIVRD